MASFFGKPGKQHPNGGHVLFDGGRRGLALEGFDVGGHRDGLNVFEVAASGLIVRAIQETQFLNAAPQPMPTTSTIEAVRTNSPTR